MPRIIRLIAAFVLLLHGLIHLMGAVVYMRLGAIEGLDYKTTLLDGRWDLGEGGIYLFGVLWLLAALGFAAAAVAFLTRRAWWPPALTAVTLFSLALTALDWRTAFAGVVINLAILAALALRPRLAARFTRQA